MLRAVLRRAASSTHHTMQIKRGMHTRNKKAKEFMQKGLTIYEDVTWMLHGHPRPNDEHQILLRKAREFFELALEVDNLNTEARRCLGHLHVYYDIMPGACEKFGYSLIAEAADMDDPAAQYEFACVLRTQKIPNMELAFEYLSKAATKLEPRALFLLGGMYLSGDDSVAKDLLSAAWCLNKASEKGHEAAAIAYGALVLQGIRAPEKCPFVDIEGPQYLVGKGKEKEISETADITGEIAEEKFTIAALKGVDLAFIWLARLRKGKISMEPALQ